MTDAPEIPLPRLTFERTRTDVDPPSEQFVMDLAAALADGERAAFVDLAACPAQLFYTKRWGAVFVVQDAYDGHQGTFASLGAAIRDGWSTADVRVAEAAKITAWLDGTGPCPWPVEV